MHPPFFTTDHRSVVHVPTHVSHSTPIRRGAPTKVPATLFGLGHTPHIPTYLVADVVPDTGPTTQPIRLVVVPDPTHRSIRDIIGRWLIRLGQRMILENRLG